MFWLINRTEPSQKANCAPPEWKLNAQSSLSAGTQLLTLQPQLIGALVRPLIRTDSSVLGAPIQIGQSSITVILPALVLFPVTIDDSPIISMLLKPSVISAKRHQGSSAIFPITPSSSRPLQAPPAVL